MAASAMALALSATLVGNVPAAAARPSDPVVPVAVEMAAAAGIAQTQVTFDAVVQDFDGDGLPDFLLGHHGTTAMQLFVNDGDGTFSQPNPNMFDRPDRHDCAAADVNQDGRPDIACAVGADHGVGIKRNQLWIQNPGPTLGFTESGVAAGIVDPFGRGRAPVFFDANNDGLPDLFMQNEPDRPDGYPSQNRFYLNVGGGVFADAPSYGLDTDMPTRELGTGCAQAADVNADGYRDLMVCVHDHLHIFLNEGGTHFVDSSADLRVDGDSPNDAMLQDINGDGLPDLLEVSKSSFVVRLQQRGVFHASSFSYALTSGAALAVGDVNGDGQLDVYVVQAGDASGNVDDAMLLNATVGTSVDFVPMTIPQVSTGIGQSAFPIDYDGNGLTDFLVLNGQNEPGPLELIAFFSAPPGPSTAADAPTPPAQGLHFAASGVRTTDATCGPAFSTVGFAVEGTGTPRVNGFSGTSVGAWSVGTVSGSSAIADRWDGSSWTSIHVPGLTGSESGLNGVISVKPNDAWAVGYQTSKATFQTAALHWDGSSWSVVTTPNEGDGDNALIAASAASSADVWAAGYQTDGDVSAPLALHWDGTTWNAVDMATDGWDRAKVTGLLVLGSADVWAVGWSATAGVYSTLLEHWDGTAWSIVPAPVTSGGDGSLLTAIASDKAGGAWAVGYTETGGLDQTLVERFNGSVWSAVPSPDPNGHADVLRAVTALSTGDAWAGGMTLTSEGRYLPLLEHWDGHAWNVFAGAAMGLGDSPVQAVGPLSRSDVWSGGEGPMMEHLCPVAVRDAGFSPSAATGAQGQSVLWQVPKSDASTHSVTDASGLGLFDSGALRPGASFQATYVGAGTYAVEDTVTGDTSKVQVPLRLSPPSGPVGTTFSIVWASANAPAGLTYDVRIQMPGSADWTPFYRGTDPSAPFVPTESGTYGFRARVGSAPLGVFSGWCPTRTISVT